jgi:helix-turn-helix protein
MPKLRKRRNPPTPRALIQFDERFRYTIPETAQLLKQSRAQTYIDIRTGKLQAFKDGRRTYVKGVEILRRSGSSGSNSPAAPIATAAA